MLKAHGPAQLIRSIICARRNDRGESTDATGAREPGSARSRVRRVRHAHGAAHDCACPRSARAGRRRLGSRDPDNRRSAPASTARIRAARRQARRENRDSQLRSRRLRHVVVVGHRRDGRRSRAAASGSSRRGDRLRRRRAHRRPATAAQRIRRHHLRGDGTARHDVEHVARRVHADVGFVYELTTNTRVGRAVSSGHSHCVSPAAAARRSQVRHLVDRQLRAGGRSKNRERIESADARRNAHRIGGARAGRAPLSVSLCHSAVGNALRAVDLSRSADAGLRRVRRPDPDPPIRNAAGRDVARGTGRSSTARAWARRRCSATRISSRSKGNWWS